MEGMFSTSVRFLLVDFVTRIEVEREIFASIFFQELAGDV
jgi:hypothetical protein